MVEFEKLYNEIFAVVSLKYFWSGYADGFIKGESPDWFNVECGTGVEVSQALLQSDGEAQSIVNQYLGKLKSEIPPEALSRYGDRAYFYNGRLWAITPEGGPDCNAGYEEKALFRFADKLEKLNNNYTLFGVNTLYLYLHAMPSGDEVAAISERMRALQSGRPARFDAVFLNGVNALHVLSLESGSVETVPIPDDALAFLRTRAELLRHCSPWQNGANFTDTETLLPQN